MARRENFIYVNSIERRKLEMTFNTESFIRLVESRKAIWDTTSDEHDDIDVRNERWQEITNILCEGNVSEKEKDELGQSLRHKWKNIRTSYIRELKRRAGVKSESLRSRKSPYVYFNQLQFLRNVVSFDDSIKNETDEDSQPLVTRKKKIKTEDDSKKKKKKTEDDSIIEVIKKSIAVIDENEQKRESDTDRLFMLSLLDDFKNIPKHHKLSAKMELIRVIKTAQMLPVAEDNLSEFPTNRRSYPNYEPRTYSRRYQTQPVFIENTSHSAQVNNGPESSGTSGPDRQDTITAYDEVLSPTETNASDTYDSEF